jgi:DUF1365 family protein
VSTYEGWVRHRRYGDVEHEFRRPISMTYEEVDGAEQRDLVERETGVRPDGPVHRLHAPRSLGVAFNPVRFHYCRHEGELLAVVAEVTNTPWGEHHSYVLDPAGGRIAKAMHVSPFQPMDQEYAWKLTEPGEQVVVHLENLQDGRRTFDATLRMTRTERAPRRAQTLRSLLAIYGQALRLKLKGAPYHPHPRTVR